MKHGKWMRPLWFGLLVIVALGNGLGPWRPVRGQEPCSPPAASVLAWYRGENNAGDSAGASDGYTLGGVSFAPGKIGQAFRFDGLDDRVVIPASPRTNVGPGDGFTVEFWINPDRLTAGRIGVPVLEWNDGSGGAGAGVQLWLSRFCIGDNCRDLPGTLFANLVDAQGQSHLLQSNPSAMRAGEWQHIALTFEKASGSARLYRNGELESGAFFEVFTPRTDRDLYLGARPNSDQALFQGLLDDLSIHNRWMAQDDVRAVFQAGAAAKCAPACAAQPAGLLAWYRAEGNGADAAGLHPSQLKNGAAIAAGKAGQAFQLDGLDDFIEVPDTPVLKPARLSVEAWARFDALDTPGAAEPGLQFLVFKQNTRASQFEGFALYKIRREGVDRLVFGLASAAGVQAQAVSKTPVVARRFHHIVGTYDGAVARLYVDGALEAETPAGFLPNYGTRPLYLGTSGEPGYDGRFHGALDEVSIYSRALAAQEVKTLFTSLTTGKCLQAPPPVNTPPTIAAADPVAREQGSAATEVLIAKVSDAQTPAGELNVSATPPAGITLTNLKNNAGTITAEIAAQCNAAPGANAIPLSVVDGNGGMAQATLTVLVAANSPPRLGPYAAASLSLGGAVTVTPGAAPADNGSIASISVAAEGFAGSLSVNGATGAVTIGNARPAGNFTVTVRATDNCGAVMSASFSLAVAKFEAAIALTPSSAQIYSPQTLRLTATVFAVNAVNGTPTGSVTFRDGTTALGTVALDAQGRAAFDASGLPAGPRALAAAYGGDADFAASTSPAVSVTVIAATALGLASAANYTSPVAPDSVVASFGQKLATSLQIAQTLPLPTTLAGTTLKVRDAAGTERAAPLFFVSPAQINCLLPRETASGPATVLVTAGDGSLSFGTIEVARVAPALFSADGSGAGLASGFILRVKADGTNVAEPIARFDSARNQFVAVPIELGAASDQVFLILYATGLRYHGGLSGVTASIGGVSAPVHYAGEQGAFAGLDQINLQLSRTLAGRGEVEVAVAVGAKAANKLRIAIR